ncbi:MAG: multidrug efflux RND transporter permease subunit [Lentisphaeraceae bacterium]|nr:multidrug efflux RND transporter permease subunit [Lentisphaeraceae bacterium]
MLSHFFIRRPKFAFVISIVIMIGGVVSMLNLPVAQYPQITPPQVEVSAFYPGANAETLEKTIAAPLESVINGVENMLYMSSKCTNDGSVKISITFESGSDGETNAVNVQNRVSTANSKLPESVIKQGVTVKQKSSNMLMVVNLFSAEESYDNLFLSNYASINLRDRLLRVPGVGDVVLFGGQNYAMRLWLNPDRMSSLKITPVEVIQAVKDQNVQVAAGQIGRSPAAAGQQFQYTVQAKGRLSEPEEFEKIIVKANSDGSFVRLKDIARVELGAESYDSFSKLNGKPGVIMALYQLPSANALDVAAAVRQEMEVLKTSFPQGVVYDIIYDTTNFISSSIDEVISTLFVAVLLVIFVVYLFFQDFRSTLIPILTIPVSLIGTFAALMVFGYSINIITLFGLILAIGVVVDDAIVVLENVQRLMNEKGLSPVEATRQAMTEVSGPIVATTLVLLAVFVPVAFLPGITGELYRQFAITISVAVCISSLNALTLSPALCACFLKPIDKDRQPMILFRWFNAFFDWLTERYTRVVSFSIRRIFITGLAFIVLIFFTWKAYDSVPGGFVPDEDQGSFMVDIQLPDGASQERTIKIISEAEEAIASVEGVKAVMSVTGFGMISASAASNAGFLIVVLDDWSERTTRMTHIRAIIFQAYRKLAVKPEAQIYPFAPPSIPGLGKGGGFEFVLQDTQSRSAKELAAVSRAFIQAANQREEIGNTFTFFRAETPQLFVDVDREKAQEMGVAINDIFTTLQINLGGTYINDFNKFGQVYRVMAQADAEYRNTPEDISSLYVKSHNGDMVPLGSVVEVSSILGPSSISRYNLFRSVKLNGSAAAGFSTAQAITAMEEVADDVLPAGYTYDWTGMAYQEKLATGKTGMIFGLALVFIFLFLVAQYESWLIPLAVLLSVPVAFFGGLGLTWLLGQYIPLDNNIYTQIGLVLLFGLASKTAILIVEFAKEKHEAGESIVDAAVGAARLRFRAVVMTAVSFILGVIPLVIASGAGSSSRRSLGVVVFGGMLVAGVIGTLMIPAFYVLIERLRVALKKK